MSDLQRALILAQGTNADALLQVERASLSPRERAFAVVKGVLTEIDADPQNSIGAGGPAVRKKVVVDELVFEFRAKLIDVKSGDILLSVGGSQGTSTIEPVNQAVLVEANFRESTRVNLATPKRVKATIDAVLEVVFSHLQRPDAPAAAPPAAPVVSGSVSM